MAKKPTFITMKEFRGLEKRVASTEKSISKIKKEAKMKKGKGKKKC